MILDELDSGVGSRLGQPVAAMLRRMTAAPAGSGAGHGTATQILCVSHIPQVHDLQSEASGIGLAMRESPAGGNARVLCSANASTTVLCLH